MVNALKDIIENRFPFLNSSKLLVAISGGIDSVVLTHLCSQLQMDITLAHCNFNLRGTESNADASFILELAEELDLEVFIQGFDTKSYAKNNKLSTQMAARELRYNWFEELAEHLGFEYILTAHHADDNLETFLINLSRGTGLDGLAGIPEINNKVVRPLLSFPREMIEHFAKENEMVWREDSSNISTKYLRNKLRHDIIPVLKEINPQLLQNFNKTQRHLKDAKDIIKDRIETVVEEVITEINAQEIRFNITEILNLNYPKAYLYELLKGYGFSEWNDVYKLLKAQSGKQVLSATHRLIKDRDCLLLSEIKFEEQPDIIIPEYIESIEIPIGTLKFDEADTVFEIKNNAIFVDKRKLQFPLTIRKYQEGDVFYPLGMTGKKKLSKYFKDEKLSLIDKENVWLLCSGGNIVWVINRRADDRFKVTGSTDQIVKITLDHN